MKEGWKERLFAYVKKGNHIRDFIKYEPQLRSTYTDAYIERYILHVYWIIEHARERNRVTYQEMCGLLKDVCELVERNEPRRLSPICEPNISVAVP